MKANEFALCTDADLYRHIWNLRSSCSLLHCIKSLLNSKPQIGSRNFAAARITTWSIGILIRGHIIVAADREPHMSHTGASFSECIYSTISTA